MSYEKGYELCRKFSRQVLALFDFLALFYRLIFFPIWIPATFWRAKTQGWPGLERRYQEQNEEFQTFVSVANRAATVPPQFSAAITQFEGRSKELSEAHARQELYVYLNLLDSRHRIFRILRAWAPMASS